MKKIIINGKFDLMEELEDIFDDFDHGCDHTGISKFKALIQILRRME